MNIGMYFKWLIWIFMIDLIRMIDKHVILILIQLTILLGVRGFKKEQQYLKK